MNKEASVNAPKTCQKFRWLKNGTAFNFPADGRISRVDKGEKLALVFKTCELDDAGIATAVDHFEDGDNGNCRHLEL